MTPDEVDTLLVVLQSAYPYVVVSTDTNDLWERSLATSDRHDMADAVEWWVAHEPRFPTIAELHQALRERRMPAITAAYCNGSGLLQSDPDHPCPVCNPATALIFADPALKRRWRNGEPTHLILGMPRAEYDRQYNRPRCQPEEDREDPDDPLPSPERASQLTREIIERMKRAADA
jgi:hypothetical protein